MRHVVVFRRETVVLQVSTYHGSTIIRLCYLNGWFAKITIIVARLDFHITTSNVKKISVVRKRKRLSSLQIATLND